MAKGNEAERSVLEDMLIGHSVDIWVIGPLLELYRFWTIDGQSGLSHNPSPNLSFVKLDCALSINNNDDTNVKCCLACNCQVF